VCRLSGRRLPAVTGLTVLRRISDGRVRRLRRLGRVRRR
jgi:hypothetical protein